MRTSSNLEKSWGYGLVRNCAGENPDCLFGSLSVRIHDDSCFAAHAVVAAGSSYA